MSLYLMINVRYIHSPPNYLFLLRQAGTAIHPFLPITVVILLLTRKLHYSNHQQISQHETYESKTQSVTTYPPFVWCETYSRKGKIILETYISKQFLLLQFPNQLNPTFQLCQDLPSNPIKANLAVFQDPKLISVSHQSLSGRIHDFHCV